MSANDGKILYLPIQVNGGLSDKEFASKGDNFLKHRELFVTNEGTLYVGVEAVDGQGGSKVVAVPVAGRVLANTKIVNPTMSGEIFLGSGIVVNKTDITDSNPAKLLIVDDGQFYLPDDSVSDEALAEAINALYDKAEELKNMSISVSGASILHAEVEDILDT